MPPTSPTIASAQESSHQVHFEARLLADKSPMAPIGNILPGGTVTLDVTANQMRTCSFQFVDDPRAPVPTWLGKLNPTGAEVLLRYGISTGPGQIAWFNLGIFGINEVDVESSVTQPGPVWTITGYDRSAEVSASLLTAPFTAKSGQAVHEIIYSLIRQQTPRLTQFNLKPSNVVPFTQNYQNGDDPWQAAVEIAQSGGCVLYFDPSGVLTLREVPTGKNTPVSMGYVHGSPRMTATDVKRSVSANPGYNGVQVIASTTKGNTITAIAWDDNPASPTYYRGPYGKRPAPPVSLTSVQTGVALRKVAKKLLASVLGLTRQSTIQAIPAPWLDAYDLVRVRHPGSQVDTLEMVTGFTMPLDLSLMSLTTTALGSPPSDYVSAVAALTEQLPATFGVAA